MERVLKDSDLELWFGEIFRPDDFFSPFKGAEYVVLLVVIRNDVTNDEQKNLSELLVATGCRCAVCFGYECSSWDDSIDYASILSDPNFEPPEERFIMTTWHDYETIEDVVEFFRLNTVFDDFVPERFLVLFFGHSAELESRTRRALDYSFVKSTAVVADTDQIQ
ncbi:MAG: DUF7684 family protein [Pyrinomonadaceae bacterium]